VARSDRDVYNRTLVQRYRGRCVGGKWMLFVEAAWTRLEPLLVGRFGNVRDLDPLSDLKLDLATNLYTRIDKEIHGLGTLSSCVEARGLFCC
jgi:hypothetical protein